MKDKRYNYNAFTCGFCEKRHTWEERGQYHTTESAYWNNAPKWRYPKEKVKS